MNPHEISALRQVTATVVKAAEARMTALRADEAAIIRQMAELDVALHRRTQLATVEDPARRAGVDLRWEAWVEQNRRALVAAQARLRVKIEHEQHIFRHSFGRDMAVAELMQSALTDQQRQARRRAEREGC